MKSVTLKTIVNKDDDRAKAYIPVDYKDIWTPVEESIINF